MEKRFKAVYFQWGISRGLQDNAEKRASRIDKLNSIVEILVLVMILLWFVTKC